MAVEQTKKPATFTISYEETKHFDRLLNCLPQQAWIE